MSTAQISVSLLLSLFVGLVSSNNGSFGGRAYVRYAHCRTNETGDNAHIRRLGQLIIPVSEISKPLGYFGTVGIYAGNYPSKGPAQYAAKAALRVGADRVAVVCLTTEAGDIMADLPDIDMYPLADINANLADQTLMQQDVVLIGPGLAQTRTSIDIMNRLIKLGKTNTKPIVLDLDQYFITQELINQIVNYPPPGIVLTLNVNEFEKLYPLIKAADAFGDAHVSIDWTKLGPNVMLYRKGCTDSAISANPAVGWSLSEGGSKRRSPGQGSAIAGALSVYFQWALKTLPAAEQQPMVVPSAAALSAATLIRECNARSFRGLGMSALTSDMIEHVAQYLYIDMP